MDTEAYAAYVQATAPALAKYGGRPLVRGGAMTEMEGEARGRNVVIEFESLDQARAFHHSPEYQAAKALRETAAVADVVAVEGV